MLCAQKSVIDDSSGVQKQRTSSWAIECSYIDIDQINHDPSSKYIMHEMTTVMIVIVFFCVTTVIESMKNHGLIFVFTKRKKNVSNGKEIFL
jgi:hypothetical protein